MQRYPLCAVVFGLVGVVALVCISCNNRQILASDVPDGSGTLSPDMAGPYSDFPAVPFIDNSGPVAIPTNIKNLFGAAKSGAMGGGADGAYAYRCLFAKSA